MSETEHKKGKLTPTGKTVSEFMEGLKIPEHYSMPEDLNEWFEDCFYKSAIEVDGEVYNLTCVNVDVDMDIANANKNDDGTIDYEVKFYNGGCSFTEAMESALKKIK